MGYKGMSLLIVFVYFFVVVLFGFVFRQQDVFLGQLVDFL